MPDVAIAHEWLLAYGGSERCVEEMLAIYPNARLLTTIVDASAVPQPLRSARPSFLQHMPLARRHRQWFLPLMPLSWALRRPVKDVDIVISSSHACAKAVRVAAGIPHLCYCHTPMRYAWNFAVERNRVPRPLQPAAAAAMSWFRHWDRATSDHVTHFLANSTAVAARIERFYGRAAEVIHPPVRTHFFMPGAERGSDFLYVGRLVGYKSPRVLLRAFAGLPFRLKIVGDGPERSVLEREAPPNVSFLGEVDERSLLHLYQSARAFVYPADEDFGIAMAEAQACGTPVIALDAGGARDIVIDGRTGWLVQNPRPDEIRRAVLVASTTDLDENEIARSAKRFSAERFRDQIKEAVETQLRLARTA